MYYSLQDKKNPIPYNLTIATQQDNSATPATSVQHNYYPGTTKNSDQFIYISADPSCCGELREILCFKSPFEAKFDHINIYKKWYVLLLT